MNNTNQEQQPNRKSQEQAIHENRLLAEYQAAQDSAQHHDNLVWIVSGIIWAANLALLGFLADSLQAAGRFIFIAVCILAILLLIFVWGLQRQFADIKREKYRRCKEIEELLEMQQHRCLKYPRRRQSRMYDVIMIAFIALWLSILIVLLAIVLCQFEAVFA